MTPLLTPKQVAALLQVSENTARAIMREEGALRVGHQLRWTQARLERYLRACTSEPPLKTACDERKDEPSGVSGATTIAGNDTKPAPTRQTGKPLSSLPVPSNASARRAMAQRLAQKLAAQSAKHST